MTHAGVVIQDKMKQPSIVHEPWVPVEGVARHLGVAKDTVCRWIEQNCVQAPDTRRRAHP
jgi:sarcosine oxidase delta subunit